MAPVLLLLVLQLVLVPLTAMVCARHRLGFHTAFYGVFVLLIVIPFHIIYLHSQGILDLDHLAGRVPEAKISLSLGSGWRPMACLFMFQLCYLCGGLLISSRQRSLTLPMRWNANRYQAVGLGLFLASVTYMAVRYFFIPDFPLFAVIANHSLAETLRDTSFEYASRTDVPYLFLPSINGNVCRIVLPYASFMLMAYALHNKQRMTQIFGSLAFLFSLAICLGQFKRAPLCYLVLWYVFQRFYSGEIKYVARLFVVFVLLLVIMTAITSTYNTSGDTDWARATTNLLWRFFVGEAVGEYVAIEHFGTTFDYLGLDIAWRYGQKVMGMDVMTFSEYWKQASGGFRGYTSVGIMTELFISFGPALAVISFLLVGMGVAQLDKFSLSIDSKYTRPFIAGLVVVVAFASVKGGLSQLFTGGGIVLLALYWATILYARIPQSQRRLNPRLGMATRPRRSVVPRRTAF